MKPSPQSSSDYDDHEEGEEEGDNGNDSWTLEKAKVGSKNSGAFSNTAGCSVDSDFKSSPFNQRLLQHHHAHHNNFFSVYQSCQLQTQGGSFICLVYVFGAPLPFL